MTDPMRPTPPIEAGVLVYADSAEKRMVVEALRIFVMLTQRQGANGGPPASLLRALRRAEAAADIALTQRCNADATVHRDPEPIVGGMTIAEYVAATGKSRQSVEARIRRGTLPAERDARGRWVIALDAVSA